MFQLIRIVTFLVCLGFLAPLIILETIVGAVLMGVGSGLGLAILMLPLFLSAILSHSLTFGGVLPWCRAPDQLPNRHLVRACTVAVTVATLAMLYLYSSITVLDAPQRRIEMAKIGMTKPQVAKIIGQPDWKEGGSLWAYRLRGDGFAGIFVPNYFSFDKNGLLESVFS